MPTPPPQLPLFLISAFAIAFTSQLVRQLMKETPPRARRLLASAVGAGIAGVASLGLLLEWIDVSAVLLLAVSSIVGWSGAGVLGVLGGVLEARLGVRLPGEQDEHPRKTRRHLE